MKLYELTSDYANLIEAIESGELTTEEAKDTLEGIEQGVHDKAQSVVAVMKQLDHSASACDEEIKRLQEIKKTYSNHSENLKDYLRFCMTKAGVDKSKGLFSVSIGKPSQSVVIDDESKIPESMKQKVITYKVSKTDIGKVLKSGEEVPGARLEEGKPRLTIR